VNLGYPEYEAEYNMPIGTVGMKWLIYNRSS